MLTGTALLTLEKEGHMKTMLRRCVKASCDERGAATAEYAIATMAAVGLAGLLVSILRGDVVRSLLEGLITGALHVGG